MITVFGLGFVGLTTALGFSYYGYQVYGLDVNLARKEMIRGGEIPFHEPYLHDILEQNQNRVFHISDDPILAVKNSQFIFLCVGTPYGNDGEADLSAVFACLDEISLQLKASGKTIIIKSTVPPSTTKDRIIPYLESKGLVVGVDCFVANNPEFLREGNCWNDFIKADRIVIGSDNDKTAEAIVKLYEPFKIPCHVVSYNTGEFIKYLSNTFLASMISFSNEMAMIADTIGDIEITDSFRILHMDKRWESGDMKSYVYPGCGYGGYCLPKDTSALYAQSVKKGYEPQILKEVIEVNKNRTDWIVKQIMGQVSKDEVIGILGLSFKPNSNDVRESVSAKVIEKLLKAGYTKIIAFDPIACSEFQICYEFDINYANSLVEMVDESSVLILLTAWEIFKEIPHLTDKLILDYRYLL